MSFFIALQWDGIVHLLTATKNHNIPNRDFTHLNDSLRLYRIIQTKNERIVFVCCGYYSFADDMLLGLTPELFTLEDEVNYSFLAHSVVPKLRQAALDFDLCKGTVFLPGQYLVMTEHHLYEITSFGSVAERQFVVDGGLDPDFLMALIQTKTDFGNPNKVEQELLKFVHFSSNNGAWSLVYLNTLNFEEHIYRSEFRRIAL